MGTNPEFRSWDPDAFTLFSSHDWIRSKKVQSMPYLEINQGDDPPTKSTSPSTNTVPSISPDGVVLSSLDRERGRLEKKRIGEGEREGSMANATSSLSIPSFYTPKFLQRWNGKDQDKDQNRIHTRIDSVTHSNWGSKHRILAPTLRLTCFHLMSLCFPVSKVRQGKQQNVGRTFSSTSHSSGYSSRLNQSRFKICMPHGEPRIYAIFGNFGLYEFALLMTVSALPMHLNLWCTEKQYCLLVNNSKQIRTKREDHNEFSMTNKQWKEMALTVQIHKMFRLVNIVPQKENRAVIDENLLCDGLGRWGSVEG